MEQMGFVAALKQINDEHPNGIYVEESSQVEGEFERREMGELIEELEYDAQVYEADESPYELEYIIEWSGGKAYLTNMTREGYRDETNEVMQFVEWEEG